MSENQPTEHKKISPAEFMRQLRPEYYSDSEDRTTYQLDAGMLEYHLNTATSRNQTHDFEIFCRKLCERTICPNLLPATGPEGGGDSKADTETFPVADEISTLSYVGIANAGQERWAFAFSAMKTWGRKVRSDVAGIVTTNRGYKKIICVTSQFARAKERAQIEDELTKQYGVPVTVLDRTWIVEQVIGGDRKDLAFNYLGIGKEVAADRRLGPSDYSRTQQLEDIEKTLKDPQFFAGMEMQLATETLVAAKLSRNLELPRIETDGRFLRAVRLAEAHGTFRQRLNAKYELIWTAFWWFDDIALLNSEYDAFEVLTSGTDSASNLELLCNLAQLLFNSVIHGHLTTEQARLAERIARLNGRLQGMADDMERPNNALEAQTSLLLIRVNQATLERDPKALAVLWPQFSDVVGRAKGLGEFSAERLIKLIEVFGNVAGKDPGYARLVDEVAAFVSERTGEAQGALVLLKRAEQIGLDDPFEVIRLLGKASRQLAKKEYVDALIDAMQLLSLAYRSAGLLWAARASCIFTLASIFIDANESSDLPASVVPTIMLLGWIAVELGHLPEALEAIRLARGCASRLPLDDASKERVGKRLWEFDMLLGSRIVNFTSAELERASALPDVLDLLGLTHSRSSLLYALGHEAVLRADGSLPAEETPERVAEMFTLLASQLASDNLHGPVIFNEPEQQIYVSRVLGVRIEVHHHGSESSILAAEAVIGAIEALFATALDFGAHPHTERFKVTIQERTDATETDFALDQENMAATVHWPTGRFPATYGQDDVQKMLIGLATSIFVVTCFAPNMAGALERFFTEEAVLDRIAMIAVIGNSHQRIFISSVSRLSDWAEFAKTRFALEPSRPTIVRRKLASKDNEKKLVEEPDDDADRPVQSKDHRDHGVRSIIDIHLWGRAKWTGTAFADWGVSSPPAIALMFTDRDAARKIFERWRERFGAVDRQNEIFVALVRGISIEKPAHYRVLITSVPPLGASADGNQPLMIAARIHTMHAESDVNLTRFLGAYERAGAYLLLPAIWTGKGEPDFLLDLAILKRELSVKTAAQVGEHDIESIALRPE